MKIEDFIRAFDNKYEKNKIRMVKIKNIFKGENFL